MQLHLFDNGPVVGFQVRCSGIADIEDDQAQELTMHNSVVMVVVGTIDAATHKTLSSGDVVRVNSVKITDAAVARGEMRLELLDMFHLDGGQLTFNYPTSAGSSPDDTDEDIEAGELPAASLSIVQPLLGKTQAQPKDPALAAFLSESR